MGMIIGSLILRPLKGGGLVIAGLHEVPDSRSGFCKNPFIVGFTWTPKVCKIMAFMAVSMGLRPSFYILLGFRV